MTFPRRYNRETHTTADHKLIPFLPTTSNHTIKDTQDTMKNRTAVGKEWTAISADQPRVKESKIYGENMLEHQSEQVNLMDMMTTKTAKDKRKGQDSLSAWTTVVSDCSKGAMREYVVIKSPIENVVALADSQVDETYDELADWVDLGEVFGAKKGPAKISYSEAARTG